MRWIWKNKKPKTPEPKPVAPIIPPVKQDHDSAVRLNCSNIGSLYGYDELLPAAIEVVMETRQASVSILQHRLKLGYSRAARLIDQMEEKGIIGPFNGSVPRTILLTREQWSSVERVSGEEDGGISKSLENMDGHQFEYFIADLLRKLSYENVEVTKGSGDQGVDVLAEKDGITYAIQCKYYSSPLGNTPVQEVAAGRDFYGCHVGVVVTNSTFTQGAIDLAKKVRILLWDGKKLTEMIDASKIAEKPPSF